MTSNPILLGICFCSLCVCLNAQQLELEWDGQEVNVVQFVEGGLERFAIEGHTASITDRITFKIRGLDALTLYQGGSVSIGTLIPHSSALLDLSSINKGFLPPRMGSVERTNIGSAAIGLMVFDLDTESPWFYKSSGWAELGTGSGGGGVGVPGSNRILDTDGDTKVDVEENADEDIVRMDLGGVESLVFTRSGGTSFSRFMLPNNDGNIIIGENSLTVIDQFDTGDTENNIVIGNDVMTTSNGFNNVAIGNRAMRDADGSFSNVAIGTYALQFSTSAQENVAIGTSASNSATSASRNTVVGYAALSNNSTGSNNIAVGHEALRSNTASSNTAVGNSALRSNMDGTRNVAMGLGALTSNVSGNDNTAIGFVALQTSTGSENTAIGSGALNANVEGIKNTAIGFNSMHTSTSADNNVAIGHLALRNVKRGGQNTAIGVEALSILPNDYSGNTAVGFHALHDVAGSSNTAVGNGALANISLGFNNTAVGYLAGGSRNTGNGAVFLGYKAGYRETMPNRLHIANNENSSLIYGEFDNKVVEIDGSLAVNGALTSNTSFEMNTFSSLGSQSENFAVLDNQSGHVAHFRNSNTSGNGDGIKITINRALIDRTNNFLTFHNGSNSIGRIEGFRASTDWAPPDVLDGFEAFACYMYELIGIPISPEDLLTAYAEAAAAIACRDGGVTYASGSGDYAEWLEREDPAADLVFGQVVGVRGGKISVNTSEAEQLMVISMSPIVLGNMPAENEDLYEKVAFMGQVPVWVRGQVEIGDYLVPSGDEDGLALAIAPEKLELKHVSQIIGRTWSQGSSDQLNLVNSVVGIRTPELAHIVNSLFSELKEKNSTLQSEVADLKKQESSMNSRLSTLENIVLKNVASNQ